jgi:spermidine synthase
MDSLASINTRDRASKIEVGALLTSIFIIATCGLIYELIIGTLSSYLLGDSIFQFSITIGFFLTAMGIGFTAVHLRRNRRAAAFHAMPSQVGRRAPRC